MGNNYFRARDGRMSYGWGVPRRRGSNRRFFADRGMGMRLNSYILVEDLGALCRGFVCHGDYNNASLEAPLFLPKRPESLQENYLYITTAEKLENAVLEEIVARQRDAEMPAFYTFIVIGKPAERFLHCEFCDVIWTDGSIDENGLFNTVQQLFVTYAEWVDELRRTASTSDEISDLVQVSTTIVKNDIIVYGRDFGVVAYEGYKNVRLTQAQVDEIAVGGFMPHAFQDDMLAKEVSDSDVFITKEPSLISVSDHQASALTRPIAVPRNMDLMLMFESNNKEVSKRDHHLIHILAYYIEMMCSKFDAMDLREEDGCIRLFKKMLFGISSIAPFELERTISEIGWSLSSGNDYVCAVFGFKHLDAGQRFFLKPVMSVCTVLREAFECVAFSYNSEVVCIVNITESQMAMEQFIDQVINLVNGNKLRTYWAFGVSRKLADLEQIGGYYAQAKMALELAKRRDDSHSIFGQDALDVAAMSIEKDIPLDFYCSDVLHALAVHDRENGTELYQTLRHYLRNRCSPTATCKEMFIHRSSLSYRLEKIDSLFHINFDDPDTRLMMELSFRMADGLPIEGDR